MSDSVGRHNVIVVWTRMGLDYVDLIVACSTFVCRFGNLEEVQLE